MSIEDGLRTSAPAISLRRNISWSVMGTAIFTLTQWGLLSAIAKLLDAHALGLYGLGLAINGPLMQFACLGLRNAQATDVHDQHSFGKYFGLRVLSGLCALAIAIGVALLIYQGEAALVIGLLGVAKFIEIQSDVFCGLFQRHERMHLVARSMILRGALGLASLIALLLLTGSLPLGILAIVVSWFGVLVLHDMLTAARLLMALGAPARRTLALIRPLWRQAGLARLAWHVTPLGVAVLFVSLQHQVPRYFIEHALGTEALGYYTALIYIMTAGNQVVGAMVQPASVRLARQFSLGYRTAFLNLLGKLALLGFLCGIVGILIAAFLGEALLSVLYTPAYAAYRDLFVLLMVAGMLRYMGQAIQIGVVASRHFHLQLTTHAVILLVSVLTSWLLVDDFGLYGAGFAVLLMSAAHLLCALGGNMMIMRRMKPITPGQLTQDAQ